MIEEKLERRDSNVADEIFITQTREYKESFKCMLKLLMLGVWCVQNGKCHALFIRETCPF